MEKILIIEDSQVAQAQLEDILAIQYSLEFQGDGAPGIASALASHPDIILLDVHLPTMNGYEICSQLKSTETTRDIPVIFITAMNSEDEKVKGFEAGATDYITKPFHPHELLARIKTHLAAQNLARQSIELEKLKLFKEMAIALSHEINNPLTIVYGDLYMFEKDLVASGKPVPSSIVQIRKELEKIRCIVDKLANASRIAEKDYLFQQKMIDLHKI